MALFVPWRKFKAELDQIKQAVADLGKQIAQNQRATGADLYRLQETVRKMAGQVADLDTVLQRIEDATTKLGNDLKDVFAFIKANPNVDLSAQIAKGTAIAETLIQADVDALAEENPLPPPGPTGRK
jgi:seryl-tRNA synthetase